MRRGRRRLTLQRGLGRHRRTEQASQSIAYSAPVKHELDRRPHTRPSGHDRAARRLRGARVRPTVRMSWVATDRMPACRCRACMQPRPPPGSPRLASRSPRSDFHRMSICAGSLPSGRSPQTPGLTLPATTAASSASGRSFHGSVRRTATRPCRLVQIEAIGEKVFIALDGERHRDGDLTLVWRIAVDAYIRPVLTLG